MTAYEIRISDWSSDVGSSVLVPLPYPIFPAHCRLLRIGLHTDSCHLPLSGWPYRTSPCSFSRIRDCDWRRKPRLKVWTTGIALRSEQRRGGKEGESTGSSRWSLDH